MADNEPDMCLLIIDKMIIDYWNEKEEENEKNPKKCIHNVWNNSVIKSVYSPFFKKEYVCAYIDT